MSIYLTHHKWRSSILSQDRIHNEAAGLRTIDHWIEQELPGSPSPFKKKERKKQTCNIITVQAFRMSLTNFRLPLQYENKSFGLYSFHYWALEFSSKTW